MQTIGTKNMILAVDVDYRENSAVAAAVCFERWQDTSTTAEFTERIPSIAEYVPGQFYKRELPCIQAILAKQPYDLSAIIVDGYVYLGAEKKAGLGMYLWESLKRGIPVIGVAKNRYRGTLTESELLRGSSQKPLYITTAGVELATAKRQVASMAGAHRIPILLKQVDALCRQRK